MFCQRPPRDFWNESTYVGRSLTQKGFQMVTHPCTVVCAPSNWPTRSLMTSPHVRNRARPCCTHDLSYHACKHPFYPNILQILLFAFDFDWLSYHSPPLIFALLSNELHFDEYYYQFKFRSLWVVEKFIELFGFDAVPLWSCFWTSTETAVC